MVTDFCVRIGKRIRVLRTERGWTQTKLADHAETTQEPENGHKKFNVRIPSKVIRALGLSLAKFFEGL
jgi:transcriptional regulator with XRE-family HTH domain